MSDRSLILRADEVRAVLAGTKTMLRRPTGLPSLIRSATPGYDWMFRGRANKRTIAAHRRYPGGCWQDLRDADFMKLCPFGVPGDRLWCRETFAFVDPNECDGMDADEFHQCTEPGDAPGGHSVLFRATAPEGWAWDGRSSSHWRSATQLPRWASRLSFLVTGVRVERLTDITEADAKAEGVHSVEGQFGPYGIGPRWSWRHPHPIEADPVRGHEHCLGTPAYAFANQWIATHGPESWAASPYVWVVSFKPEVPNV